MGNPSKNPYSKSDSISYMVCDLPPGGRDQNIFSPFQALSRQWELVQDQLCLLLELKVRATHVEPIGSAEMAAITLSAHNGKDHP
jgi:hypothetical protein